MPIIAHNNLPSFSRLSDEGEIILTRERAIKQDIRELHIGLLNMMPDAALSATERQFFRLIGQSNQIAQFYLHPFTLNSIERGEGGQAHVSRYYASFEKVVEHGLDALIITGATVTESELPKEGFYEELGAVIDWAYEHVTSTICSCLATHATFHRRYKKTRRALLKKCWGVYSHRVCEQHPLLNGVNTEFNVPHSRFNEISAAQCTASNIKVLVDSQVGVHLCVSPDGFRQVFFQGHPEYDTISLLKEYKREVAAYICCERQNYPPLPENYFSKQNQAILFEYREKLLQGAFSIRDFPEPLLMKTLANSWHDTAVAIVNNWLGLVYQLTNETVNKPFMSNVDIDNPLNL